MAQNAAWPHARTLRARAAKDTVLATEVTCMKIAILDGAVLNPGDVDWSPITSLGDVSIYETTPTEAVAERTRGADVVLVNKTPLTGPNLEQMDSNVRMVGVLATG